MTTTVYNPISPPIYGSAWSFEVVLRSQADTKLIQTSVTLAAGDVLIYLDGVLDGNIDTLPVEIGASGVLVVTMSIAEMTAGRTLVKFHDQAGGQWVDDVFEIFPVVAAAVGTSDLTAGAQMDIVNAPNATGVSVFSAGNWNYTSRTLTSFGTLAADVWNRLTSALTTSGSIGKALADLLAVFNATTRTLTQSAASVTAAVSGSDIAVTRYTTYTTQITGLTIPADWEKIWLSAKPDDASSDTDAQIMILETNPGAATDGGQYFNRVAATAITRAYASLTVDQPGGTITVLIKPAGTALLAEGSYKYDLKYLRSDADDTIDQLTGEANFTVTSSYTVAIS